MMPRLHRKSMNYHKLQFGLKTRPLIVALKVLLMLAMIPALVGWDNPLLSNKQKGDVFYKEGRYSEAIARFEKAIEREGNDWKLLYDLGTAYYHDGQWDKAIEKLTYASKIAETEKADPIDQAHINHNLGLTYLQADDCENAIVSLEHAAELAPDDANIKANLEFARGYCENGSKGSGEQQNKAGSNNKEDGKGQGGQGENNDKTEAQNNASQSGDQQQKSGGEGQDKQQKDQSGAEKQNNDKQGGDQPEKNQQTEAASDENASKGTGKDQKENTSKGSDSNTVTEGGSGDQIPNDGLGLTNAQVQEILKYMSQLERDQAAQYFHNAPQEGDYLDEESMVDLIRRLFSGIPIQRKNSEPADGIDW
jgi:Ca-activated chloride channel homolog